ncbi:hypothetical protein [Rhodohalobacter sp. 614A]|uniref:hypothetical protein n=1 Tax=Rhodohalobacter sp. 614A TaxID=2908649 RepID=UPI001F202C40|nr:hypothetical protein [Rhodohalobacter sp. 614A]
MLNNIPTDNFYKFQYLAGLLIIFSTFYYLIQRIEIDNENLIKLEGQTSQLMFDNRMWEFQIDEIDSLSKKLLERDQITANELQNLRSKTDSIFQLSHSINSKMNDIALKNNLISYSIERTSKYHKYSILFLIAGIVWTAIGYFGWFFLHQKKQDRILEIELELKELELKRTVNLNKKPEEE